MQICPVCAKRVGMDLVGHITQQHGNILKVQRKRRCRRGGTSALSILRRELREGSLQSILGGSSRLVSSSTTEPDPLLSSFIHNTPLANEIPDVQPLSSAKQSSKTESTLENSSERNVEQSPLSDKDQEEKARKSKFVQGLLLSTFLEEDL
ncbi:protein DEHYDRATION-INDUCED 19 homolog 4-like [Lycium ferocissimum]|uniref:protein DEHYDRATION-INDUCED 19 homolog 4-like n=1 Tax=Lycium ferocissimum TaxID=112874 RepID=UPI0028154B2A|nr:protein DEHYDRATION-INDUCED 19 homolog 4-like [Lycium ferocissimum]